MAESIRNFISTVPHYFRTATFWDVFEVLLIGYLIYRVWRFVRHTSVERVIKGVLIMLLLAQLSQWLQLSVINFILRKIDRLRIVVFERSSASLASIVI